MISVHDLRKALVPELSILQLADQLRMSANHVYSFDYRGLPKRYKERVAMIEWLENTATFRSEELKDRFVSWAKDPAN